MKKEYQKIIISFLIGFLLSSGIVYAATLYSATEVSYNNSNSGTSKTDVQGAVDELYEKAKLTFTLSSNATAPTYTGKEGEVVIISDVTPSKYYILNEAPSNPIDGSVWLVESSDSFYKASGTDISVAIVKVKQYINSTWVEKPYCVYQNNRWNCFYGFDYTGGEQTFTVPYAGTYTLQVWGAQGGTANGYAGGYGGYSTGQIELTQNETLYINVGGQGGSTPSGTAQLVAGGYNGGGSTGGQGCCNRIYGSGGGATHIAKASGVLSSLESKKESIIIVAGGGGGSYYGSNNGTEGLLGGSGGGYIGGNGQESAISGNQYCAGLGGTQIQGGSVSTNCAQSASYGGALTGSFGQGGTNGGTATGGGGGYYGGSRSGHIAPAGGGSGYIGNSSLTNKYMYCYNCSTSSDTSSKTYTTTNVSETPISNYAKQGNGYVKISFVPQPYEFDYTGGEQTFTVPYTGTYQLEIWGAQGGTANGYAGGYGGYSTGQIELTQNETLYINVGGQGGSTPSGTAQLVAGGYNGGGSTGGQGCCGRIYGSGGGATHIAKASGVLSSLENNKSSIILVAGGGGGSYYGSNAATEGLLAGSGGGYIGGNGQESAVSGNQYCAGLGGTQTQGGSVSTNCSQSSSVGGGTLTGSFGQGGTNGGTATGGGGGYYGGSRSGHIAPAGGGSGYIGNSSLKNKYMYCYNCSTSSDIATKTYTTTNVSEVPVSNYAKKGNGYAKITLLSIKK